MAARARAAAKRRLQDLHRNRVVRFDGTQNNETRVSVEVMSFRMHFLMFQGFVRTALRRERDFWQDSPPAPGMLRR